MELYYVGTLYFSVNINRIKVLAYSSPTCKLVLPSSSYLTLELSLIYLATAKPNSRHVFTAIIFTEIYVVTSSETLTVPNRNQ